MIVIIIAIMKVIVIIIVLIIVIIVMMIMIMIIMIITTIIIIIIIIIKTNILIIFIIIVAIVTLGRSRDWPRRRRAPGSRSTALYSLKRGVCIQEQAKKDDKTLEVRIKKSSLEGDKDKRQRRDK